MKLLMENWNNYLTEQQFRDEFIQYLTENNITLTEEQLNEVNWGALAKRFGGMPELKKAVAKVGGTAAFLAALASPAQAGGFDWDKLDDALADAPAMQADAPAAQTLLSADADLAALEAHLQALAGELANIDKTGTDLHSRSDVGMAEMEIKNNYGLMKQDSKGPTPEYPRGLTSLQFQTDSGTPVKFEINTDELPALLQK